MNLGIPEKALNFREKTLKVGSRNVQSLQMSVGNLNKQE